MESCTCLQPQQITHRCENCQKTWIEKMNEIERFRRCTYHGSKYIIKHVELCYECSLHYKIVISNPNHYVVKL